MRELQPNQLRPGPVVEWLATPGHSLEVVFFQRYRTSAFSMPSDAFMTMNMDLPGASVDWGRRTLACAGAPSTGTEGDKNIGG